MIRRQYTAYSYEDAVELMKKDGYIVKYNKTRTWLKRGSPLSDKDLKVFAIEHMARLKLTMPGEGFAITIIDSGGTNRRKHPFLFKNIKRGKSMIGEKIFIWRCDDTGEIVETLKNCSKQDAIEVGKELVSKLKTDLTLEVSYQVNNNVAGHMKYKPSKQIKKGIYLFLGNEKNVLEDE